MANITCFQESWNKKKSNGKKVNCMIKLVRMFEKNQTLMLLSPPPLPPRATHSESHAQKEIFLLFRCLNKHTCHTLFKMLLLWRFVLCTIFASTYRCLYIFFNHSMKDSERLSHWGPALVKKTYMFKIFLKCIRLHRILMWIFWLSDVLCAFHKCKIFHTQINVAPSHINSK